MSSEKPKDGNELRQQRHEAAVFLERREDSLAENLQLLSKSFQIQNQDLLPEGCGVVAQFASPESNTSTTLLFDARDTEASHYRWELTSGRGGAREIWQIDSFEDEVFANRYRTSPQGQFLGQNRIEDEELQKLYQVLDCLLDSHEVQQAIDEKRARKHEVEDLLHCLAFEKNKLENHGARIYEQQYQQQRRLYENFGFTPLAPFAPPKPEL